MEQRPLRLGDIVDDYCPRERRITNHAVVALVGDAIKQTRCATCDAEHVYKDAKVPRRISLKKKDDAPGQLVPSRTTPAAAGSADNSDTGETTSEDGPHAETAQSEDADTINDRPDEGGATAWIGHRPLIRATLPRTEADPPPTRPIPEFTMHQRNTRGARAFRQGHGWQGNGHTENGNRNDRGGFNQRGGGHGQGRPGQGGGANRHRGGGGKRSR